MAGQKRRPLSPERIEIAALDLIEKDGLQAFSTRKLAAKLRCEAMSIYHYFPSKAHLMDAVLDRVLGTMAPPDPNLDWLARIRQVILEYRAMAHRYPRFFQFVAVHRHNTRIGLALLESFLAPLREAGFGTEMTARYFRALGYYLVGAALDETSGYARGPSAVHPPTDSEVARDFPNVAAVNPYFRPEQHQATFELGLDIMLASVEQAHRSLKQQGAGAPRSKTVRSLPVPSAAPPSTGRRSSSR